MKIAICSLSQFTYVAGFSDAAVRLKERHEVRYFLGFHCQDAVKLLEKKQISYEVLFDQLLDIRSVLADPAKTPSPYELFKDYFLKYAVLVLPDLIKVFKRWKPDLIVSHFRDYAGMTAAEILDIPMASFAITVSPFRVEGIDPPYGSQVSCEAPKRVLQLLWKLNYEFNKTIDQLYNQTIRRPYGLDDISGASTLHSNKLVLLSMISCVINKCSPDPPYVKYVGSLFSSNPESEETEEAEILVYIASMPQPRVVISLGTIHVEPTMKCLDALATFSGTIIVSFGGKKEINIDPYLLQRKNIVYRSFFYDFKRLLKLANAVITIASGKTVLDSLSVGKPLICLPQQGEQWEIALGLKSFGAAEIPCPKYWHPQKFAEVTEQVATETRYAKAASALQAEIKRSGGADEVVKSIETLFFENLY